MPSSYSYLLRLPLGISTKASSSSARSVIRHRPARLSCRWMRGSSRCWRPSSPPRALASCGGDGAEPGAPQGATLVLDFTAQRGPQRDLRRPGAGLLPRGRRRAGGPRARRLDRRPEAAGGGPRRVRDPRHPGPRDRPRARPRPGRGGADRQRPLASVIARADGPVARPRDLEGRSAGVTGLPSDDAVLDSVVAGDGGDPAAVERVTIGFNAVAIAGRGQGRRRDRLSERRGRGPAPPGSPGARLQGGGLRRPPLPGARPVHLR